MADKLKGNKRELNGKVPPVDMTASRTNWIKSDDPALQAKRAKDLRRLRYQTAQAQVAQDIKAKQQEEALVQQARDEKHALLLKELNKK